MLMLKVLGVIDIITAFAIFMNINLLFLTVPLFLVHLVKGILSLGADIVGKLYGMVDLVSAVVILFIFDLPVFIEWFVVIILLFKGTTSLL